MKFHIQSVAMAAVSLLLSASVASAITLSFGAGSESSNAVPEGMTGTAEFGFLDEAGDVRVSLKLSNTTPAALGGNITAFVFGLPSGVSYDGSLTDADGSNFEANTSPSTTPFSNVASNGSFDLLFGIGGVFNGGGNPNNGIGTGSDATLTFLLDTSDDAATVESAFLSGFEADGASSLGAAMRWRGLANGGSEKLLYVPQTAVVPLPAAAWLALAGLGGLGAARRFKIA